MLAPVPGAATTLLVDPDGLLPLVLTFFVESFIYPAAAAARHSLTGNR